VRESEREREQEREYPIFIDCIMQCKGKGEKVYRLGKISILSVRLGQAFQLEVYIRVESLVSTHKINTLICIRYTRE